MELTKLGSYIDSMMATAVGLLFSAAKVAQAYISNPGTRLPLVWLALLLCCFYVLENFPLRNRTPVAGLEKLLINSDSFLLK